MTTGTEVERLNPAQPASRTLDHAACYEAVRRRDGRFDGRFYTGVTTTGIFCRPSCPARTPKSLNVRFFHHAAAASEAGFRPCRRCRPELAPGHPEWNRRADLAGRAMALIEGGVVDREGVAGLARRLAVSERHLRRELKAEVGTGPLQLARARRVWLARMLLDQTNLTVTEVAFAAGFTSLRQFNDAFRQSFDGTPSALRRKPGVRVGRATDKMVTEVTLTLTGRGAIGWHDLRQFLSVRAIDGLERPTANGFLRGVPGGTIELLGSTVDQLDPDQPTDSPAAVEPRAGHDDATLSVRCRLDRLDRLADLVSVIRRVADLDADRASVTDHLRADPELASRLAVRRLPPLPGAFDPFELAVRAIVGQQVSVAGAATTLARLIDLAAPPEPAPRPDGARPSEPAQPPPIHHGGFPTAEQVVAAPLDRLGMPTRRRETIQTLARAVADDRLDLSAAAEPAKLEADLLALPGIGPWTAGYVAMRAGGNPDGWPSGDLILRRSLAVGSEVPTTQQLDARAERWRPWRGYAAMLLWATVPKNDRPNNNGNSKRDEHRDDQETS